jgi:hypothetical protein
LRGGRLKTHALREAQTTLHQQLRIGFQGKQRERGGGGDWDHQRGACSCAAKQKQGSEPEHHKEIQTAGSLFILGVTGFYESMCRSRLRTQNKISHVTVGDQGCCRSTCWAPPALSSLLSQTLASEMLQATVVSGLALHWL